MAPHEKMKMQISSRCSLGKPSKFPDVMSESSRTVWEIGSLKVHSMNQSRVKIKKQVPTVTQN